MIQKRDMQNCGALYELMIHPEVFPFVRSKVSSVEEYLFVTKQTIEAETRKECITRTIADEFGQPIGVIGLYDMQAGAGFLATWIGKPYHGRGYNQLAKDQFLEELFCEQEVERVFVKIRERNVRSIKAMEKLSYSSSGERFPALLEQINKGVGQDKYALYVIEKEAYLFYRNAFHQNESEEKEA